MGYCLLLSKPAAIHWLDASEWGLLVFGLAVFVGIWGEIKLEHGSTRFKIAEYVVLYGILGELIADGGVFLFSTQLQTISDSENAVLNKEAGDARKAAGEANEHAKLLDVRIAEAQRETATARLEQAQLEAKIASRRLTGGQKTKLRLLLESHPIPIAVARNPFDKESIDFADDFISALLAAHWPTVLRTWLGFRYGVLIGAVDEESRNSPDVKRLSNALLAIGVPNEVIALSKDDTSLIPPPAPHAMYLLIGLRPPIKSAPR